MKRKICCFAGHSQIVYSSDLRDVLREKVIHLIEKKNVSEFWVGNYGDFDFLCSEVVREIKKEFSYIKLILVIPYLTEKINQSRWWYNEKYDEILLAEMPVNTYRKAMITKCNEYIVSNADFMICYVKYFSGGAYNTYKYAVKSYNKIGIINIGEECY